MWQIRIRWIRIFFRIRNFSDLERDQNRSRWSFKMAEQANILLIWKEKRYCELRHFLLPCLVPVPYDVLSHGFLKAC